MNLSASELAFDFSKDKSFTWIDDSSILDSKYIDALKILAEQQDPALQSIVNGYVSELNVAKECDDAPKRTLINIGFQLGGLPIYELSLKNLDIKVGLAFQSFNSLKKVTSQYADLTVFGLNKYSSEVAYILNSNMSGGYANLLKCIEKSILKNTMFMGLNKSNLEPILEQMDLTDLTMDQLKVLLPISMAAAGFFADEYVKLNDIYPTLNLWLKDSDVWNTVKSTLLNLDNLGIVDRFVYVDKENLGTCLRSIFSFNQALGRNGIATFVSSK